MSRSESLASAVCQPCQGNTPSLSATAIERYASELPQWRVVDEGRRLRREVVVRDFTTALEYLGRLGILAEQEGHHPDLHLTKYRHVAIELWTHKAGGLTENDFIMAAKIDQIRM
jgi:4a-hydroxytetrahydrobiopterin dehydratase